MTRLLTRITHGPLRTAVRKSVRSLFGKRACPGALVAELFRLDVSDVSVSDTQVSITLSDGAHFTAQPAECPFSVTDLPLDLLQKFPDRSLHLAIDIVWRYVYPHAMPTIRPPPPAGDLARFHLQHQDTVDDLDVSEEERSQIRDAFSLTAGDVVLDIGAYLGVGALRLAREVGPAGRVISVEAKPQNQAAYAQLMQSNGVDHALLLKGGIWSEPGEMTFHCGERQENTLVGHLARGTNLQTVRTYSIDKIVDTCELPDVRLISLTVNGAEVEAIEGASKTLAEMSPALTIAGWYKRDGRPIHEIACPMIKRHGYEVRVGPKGRVYAWRGDA